MTEQTAETTWIQLEKKLSEVNHLRCGLTEPRFHWPRLLPAVCAAVLFYLPLGVFQSRALCLAQTDSVYFIISSFSIFVLLLWLSRLQSEIIQLFVCVKCVYCYYFLELAHCVLFWKFNGCTMPFRFPTSCLASDSIKNRLGAYFLWSRTTSRLLDHYWNMP